MVYDDTLILLVRDTIITALKIVAPILLAGVTVGLIISLVQSVTSIQDQTLTFVPKIVVMLAAAVLLMPWIARRLTEFAADLLTHLL